MIYRTLGYHTDFETACSVVKKLIELTCTTSDCILQLGVAGMDADSVRKLRDLAPEDAKFVLRLKSSDATYSQAVVSTALELYPMVPWISIRRLLPNTDYSADLRRGTHELSISFRGDSFENPMIGRDAFAHYFPQLYSVSFGSGTDEGRQVLPCGATLEWSTMDPNAFVTIAAPEPNQIFKALEAFEMRTTFCLPSVGGDYEIDLDAPRDAYFKFLSALDGLPGKEYLSDAEFEYGTGEIHSNLDASRLPEIPAVLSSCKYTDAWVSWKSLRWRPEIAPREIPERIDGYMLAMRPGKRMSVLVFIEEPRNPRAIQMIKEAYARCTPQQA